MPYNPLLFPFYTDLRFFGYLVYVRWDGSGKKARWFGVILAVDFMPGYGIMKLEAMAKSPGNMLRKFLTSKMFR